MNTILQLPKKIINFLKSIYQELRLVDWLSRKDTIRYTSIVLLIMIIFGLSLAVIDKIFTLVIIKLLTT